MVHEHLFGFMTWGRFQHRLQFRELIEALICAIEYYQLRVSRSTLRSKHLRLFRCLEF